MAPAIARRAASSQQQRPAPAGPAPAPIWAAQGVPQFATGAAAAAEYAAARAEARDHARLRNQYFQQARRSLLLPPACALRLLPALLFLFWLLSIGGPLKSSAGPQAPPIYDGVRCTSSNFTTRAELWQGRWLAQTTCSQPAASASAVQPC